MITGEMLMRHTMIPLIHPRSPPKAIPAVMANAAGMVLAIIAAVTAQTAYIEPIDKSTFPVMIK